MSFGACGSADVRVFGEIIEPCRKSGTMAPGSQADLPLTSACFEMPVRHSLSFRYALAA